MKLKKFTAIISVIMMIALFVLPLTPAAAALSGEKGSISLNLVDNATGKPLADTSFRLYFVAKAYENGNGIRYEFVSPYDEANIDLTDLQDSSLPVHLAYFVESHSLPYTEKTTDKNGKLVFDNLEKGLYLIVPVKSESDSYTISPFVISVPNYNSEEKKWESDIDASPKFIGDVPDGGSDTYISVVKKWVSDKSHPESITVVLLRDFQEYARIQLNDSNKWYYRWDNLPKNHIWNVVEENVPEGYTVSYNTSSNTVTIINKSEGKDEETTTNPSDDGETTTKPTGSGETTTKPKEEDKLVQTGQLNWPVPVCAIAGILIFSIGWAVLNFGKKEVE